MIELDLFQLGPFVDSEHPEVRRGSIDMTFDDIFHQEILGKVYSAKGPMELECLLFL